MKSFILVLLMFAVPEVKCGEVNIKIKKPGMKEGEEEIQKFSIMITHGTFDKANLKTIYTFEALKFTCLEKDQSLEIHLDDNKPEAFQVIVKKSFDFEKYIDHNPSETITELEKNSQVCFFNGYFVRLGSSIQDKAELYLKFITNEMSFDYNKILIFQVKILKIEISNQLQSIGEKDTVNISKPQDFYDINRLATYNYLTSTEFKTTKINLNGQTFEFDGLGIFNVIFTDPKYLPDPDNPKMFYGENEEYKGKLEITYDKGEVNIKFPEKKNPNSDGQPII